MARRDTGPWLAALSVVLGATVGCEDCNEEIDADVATEYEAHASCYATSPAEAFDAARESLLDADWQIFRDDQERLHLETEWKDVTIESTRLTMEGAPTRVRLDVLIVPDRCVRVVVCGQRERWQEGRASMDRRWILFPGTDVAGDLREEIHSRLSDVAQREARVGWQSR